jgi:hypothetical protein
MGIVLALALLSSTLPSFSGFSVNEFHSSNIIVFFVVSCFQEEDRLGWSAFKEYISHRAGKIKRSGPALRVEIDGAPKPRHSAEREGFWILKEKERSNFEF